MKITVGSKNPVKVEAVRECVGAYPLFEGAVVEPVSAPSGVSHQPKSLEETIEGAKNRAKSAYDAMRASSSPVFVGSNDGRAYSFGIESGLMKVPHTKTGYMDVTACAIYDGLEFHIGLSSAFEYPAEMTRLVLEENIEIDEAASRTGFTDNPDIGNAEGAIGILTKGRLSRKEYTKQAVVTALIHLENPRLYKA